MYVTQMKETRDKKHYEFQIIVGKGRFHYYGLSKEAAIERKARYERTIRRLELLKKELRYLVQYLPEQSEKIAEKAANLLFSENLSVSALPDIQKALETQDVEEFFVQYFSELTSALNVNKDDWDKKLYHTYFVEHYKIVLLRLLERRDWETILFLRVAFETGIRSLDIVKLSISCMEGRQIRLGQEKLGGKRIYRQKNGQLPKVSKRTLRLMKMLERTQGQFFTKPHQTYIQKICSLWSCKRFQIHELRRKRLLLEERLMLSSYRKNFK